MPGKFVSLILLFCLATIVGFGQKNLKEAIVVFNNADTAKGFIDYKEWFTNPASVLFTKDKAVAATRYTAAEVQYFEMVGLVRYRRYAVKVSLSTDAMSNTSGKDTSTETRTVFLKIVEEGNPLSLFAYTDKVKQRLYVLNKNGETPAELLNSIYMFNGVFYEEKQYRADLAAWTAQYKPGDARLLSQISGIGYYTNDIAAICRQINGGTEEIVNRTGKVNGGPVLRIFAGAGISMGAIKIDGDNMFAGNNSHPFYAPLADIGADLLLNPNVGKFVIRLQLHITGYKTDAYVFRDFAQYTEEYTLTFKQRNIAITPQLLYNICNKKQVKWFVAGGVGINLSSYPENKRYFIRKSSTNGEATDYSYLQYMKESWMNFCFSTGVSVNRLELSAVYYPSNSISRSTAYGVKNSSLQLRLNFFFKK